MNVVYSKWIVKKIQKHKLPKEAWIDFRDAFESFSKNKNFRLFDMKKLTTKGPHVYYRIRLRDYRALFHMDDQNIYVEDIGTRGEIYRP